MRYEEITPAFLRRAVEIYLEEAYPRGIPSRVRIPASLEAETTEEVLRDFVDESKRDGAAVTQRWILRLGNSRYPFMKFVLQEYMLEGEFVFAIDAHDEMEIRPNFPDYEAWQEVKAFNRDLRARIEARWRAEALDTCGCLADKVIGQAPTLAGRGQGKRVLVVEDEPNLAEAFAGVLRREGYEVEVVNNGRLGLERAIASRPDLVLLDYELPELDGIQVIDRLRAESATRDLPVLLASASNVSLEEMCRASAFLKKPFPAEMLVSLVEHQIRSATITREAARRERAEGGGSGGDSGGSGA